MKTVLDKASREELISRVKSLNMNSKAQWGKMNVYQMLKHCVLTEEMFLGKKKYKRAFLGRIFGKMALKKILTEGHKFKQGEPTSSEFKIADEQGDLALEKEKLISLIEEYGHFSGENFVHWFFGKMTKEQIGYFSYKHLDHHLRQFNS